MHVNQSRILLCICTGKLTWPTIHLDGWLENYCWFFYKNLIFTTGLIVETGKFYTWLAFKFAHSYFFYIYLKYSPNFIFLYTVFFTSLDLCIACSVPVHCCFHSVFLCIVFITVNWKQPYLGQKYFLYRLFVCVLCCNTQGLHTEQWH